MKVGFVSLGCSKNLIDTEIAIGKFKKNKYEIVNDPKEAEILVINTCGFIESAKEEAINTILEMANYKQNNCKYLIVMGCLAQRYYSELIKELPEVDLFIRLDEYDKFWEKVSNLTEKGKVEISDKKSNIKISEVEKMPMPSVNEFLERVITTGKNYAYLKIGEGCSNKCTYCAIPYIRGPFVSRPMEEIIEEAKNLANEGIQEIILIAQDTTKYGVDLYGKSMLAQLLNKISQIYGIKWIRFLYSYPEGITDELIDEVADNDKICNYFDIPIQHISDEVLKRMNRKTTRENIENLIKKIREIIPDVTIRTSLIVGFPGETNEQFQELYDFVKNVKFDKLGVFEYSQEDGTPAAKLPNQIEDSVKHERYKSIMKVQKRISNSLMKNKVGSTIEVLVEDIHAQDRRYFIGRTKQDVPDIDGVIYIKNDNNNEKAIINTIIDCEVIDYLEYDLFGRIIEERLPKTWVGHVGSKEVFVTWDDNFNQVRFLVAGQMIAVCNIDVMNPMEDPVVFTSNTIANELSAEARDQIRNIAKGLDIRKIKEVYKNYNRDKQKVLEKELHIERRHLVSFTEIRLDQKVKTLKKQQKVTKREKTQQELFPKEKNHTVKDINVKQELKTSAMATDLRSIGRVLDLAGKLPNINGKKITKLGIVESDKIKDIDKNAKTNSTRFSFVGIANDGSVVPIDLEQDHQEGNNPREISYRTNANGTVEQDDVTSRFKIGNSGETISIKTSNGPGNLEVGYSPNKTLGGNDIEGNKSIDTQLETSTVYWKTRKETRDAEFKGYRHTEEKHEEMKKEGNTDIPDLKEGKKGKSSKATFKEGDGDKNTKSHEHINTEGRVPWDRYDRNR